MSIHVKDLCKTYNVPVVHPGIVKNIFSLFHKQYIQKVGLAGVSFDIHPGELVGYIGPNGAGKSTTIKMLSGILVPDSGKVLVMGKTPWKHRKETVRRLGVVFGQKSQLWWELPVRDSYELLKKIYDVSDREYKDSLEYLVEALDLSKLLQIPVRNLSLGQRMRCEVASSLLHNPSILFLDEPTIGLDAVCKLALRDIIRKLNVDRSMTIMLTTHDMDDIEYLCSRVIILHEGKVYFDGALEQVRKVIFPERYLIVDLQNENDTVSDIEAKFIKQEGHRVYLQFDPRKTHPPDLIARILKNHPIKDLFVEDLSIEEIIAHFYKGASR